MLTNEIVAKWQKKKSLFRFRVYFGHFLYLGGILVILEVFFGGGYFGDFINFGVFWSF